MNSKAKIEMIITTRDRDIGGLTVRRLLPYAARRMVGPFIFFDHMGPAEFEPGRGLDVRPHPHINLATVTYLFSGKIQHKDSLGSDQSIEPGAVNWMTAGSGIVHSERTPERDRLTGSKLHGIQLWVALPEEFEEIAPSFSHHPKETLPEFQIADVKIKLLLGTLFQHRSPVTVHSDLFYAEIKLPKNARLDLPAEERELAFYVVEGAIRIDDQEVKAQEMAIARLGADLAFEALEPSHIMVLGGKPVGERLLFWNFVSTSKERLETAKVLWANGPSHNNPRFQPIPRDDQEFIPLPTTPGNPKGTIL